MLLNKDPFPMSAHKIFRSMRFFVPAFGLLASFSVSAQKAANTPPDKGAAEVALSNDTILLRYYDHVDSTDRRLMGSFFLAEERDIVLTAGMLWPVELGQHF